MHGRKVKVAAGFLLFIVASISFPLGVALYDVTHPNEAHATSIGGGGGGTATPSTGSGGLVGRVGPIALTGPVSVTGTLTLTQGVSAVTGAFDRITATSTSGDAIVGAGQGAGQGGQFTGGGTAGTEGVLGTGGSGGGPGVKGVGTGIYSGGQFEAAANGGRAVFLSGDLTSPQYAIIGNNGCQDTNPSASSNTGEITCVTSNSAPVVRISTASTTWNDVAGLLTQTTGITAFAGGGQASATAVCTVAGTFVVGTVATAGDSVKLPATPVVGQHCEIVNADGTDAMNLFPGSGDTLCVAGAGCLAADAATSITPTIRLRSCRAQSTSVWNCL